MNNTARLSRIGRARAARGAIVLAAMMFFAAAWPAVASAQDGGSPTVPVQLAPTQPETGGQAPLTTEEIDRQFAENDPYGKGEYPAKPAEFADGEWIALKKIRDGSTGHDEEAFYLLLENAPDIEIADARSVTYEQLLNAPKTFRGLPVRVTCRFVSSGSQTTARPQRIKKVYATTARPDPLPDEDPNEASVAIFSRFAPQQMGANQRFEVVGYFYKIERFPVQRGSGYIDTPVIIAHQITPITRGGGGMDKNMVVLAGVLVLLVVAWIVIRVKMSKPRGAAAEKAYRPMRFEMTESEIERSKVKLEGDSDDKSDKPSQGQP